LTEPSTGHIDPDTVQDKSRPKDFEPLQYLCNLSQLCAGG
jgi:hypothetical protein